MKSYSQSRFLDNGDRLRWLMDDVLVACPRCRRRAHIKRFTDEAPRYFSFRLTCAHCGCSRDNLEGYGYRGDEIQPRSALYMGHSLWLKCSARGHCLWALNQCHLNYLEAYIAATLRERVMSRSVISVMDPKFGILFKARDETIRENFVIDQNGRVRNGYHVVSRLPTWMVLKSNRQHVLRGFEKLRKRLKESES